VAKDQWPDVYAYLCEREQPTETYIESKAVISLPNGQRVQALVFLSDLKHPQWAGDLSLEAQAGLIAGAAGLSGRNLDYLTDLVEHLRAEGIRDSHLEALLDRVQALEAVG
jgi:cation transport protein ChaC